MQNKKLSSTIKDILAVTDSILGRPATRGQVIEVLELIESFEAPVKTGTLVVTNSKPKVKTEKRAAKRPKSHISWKLYKKWFDSVLDGKSHVIPYGAIKQEIPALAKLNRNTQRNRFRSEAIRRGYTTASVTYNDTDKTVTVWAVPKGINAYDYRNNK